MSSENQIQTKTNSLINKVREIFDIVASVQCWSNVPTLSSTTNEGPTYPCYLWKSISFESTRTSQALCLRIFPGNVINTTVILIQCPFPARYLHTNVTSNRNVAGLISYCFTQWPVELHWPKMKTLHFISLNNCFVSIHVVVRFTHAYRDIVADNDYAILNQVPSLFKRQRLINVILTLHVLRKSWFINSLKTDKKTFAAEYWK